MCDNTQILIRTAQDRVSKLSVQVLRAVDNEMVIHHIVWDHLRDKEEELETSKIFKPPIESIGKKKQT
jgi:hypothetical protein